MKDLSFRGVPELAVADQAVAPTADLGAELWSTTENQKLYWDGTKWNKSGGAGANLADDTTTDSDL